MKKTILCVAVFVVGCLISVADEKDAKLLGPVKVEDVISNGTGDFNIATYAMQNQYILAVYTNAAGDIRFELLKGGSDPSKNKKDVSQIKADTQYTEDGTATWNANDLKVGGGSGGGGGLKIVGFKGKSVIVKYTFNDANSTVRYYSYSIKSKGADVKIIGSTKGYVSGNVTDQASDGKKFWLQADYDDSGTEKVKEYTNKLEGTILKPKTAKTVYTVGENEDDAILPIIANKYSYTVDKNLLDKDGKIYDSVSIHK